MLNYLRSCCCAIFILLVQLIALITKRNIVFIFIFIFLLFCYFHLTPAERHRSFQLVSDNAQHPADTVLSPNGQREEHWPTQKHRTRTYSPRAPAPVKETQNINHSRGWFRLLGQAAFRI